MGFNTTVYIHNDEVHQIEKDPEFGKKIAYAVHSVGVDGPTRIEGYHSQVIETHHADNHIVCVVGGNMAQEVGNGAHWSEGLDMRNDEDKVKLLKNLADRLGYSLRKKPSQVKKEKELVDDRTEIAEAQFSLYDLYDNGVMPSESSVEDTGTWVEDGDMMLMNFWYTNPVVDEPYIKCTFVVEFEAGSSDIKECHVNT